MRLELNRSRRWVGLFKIQLFTAIFCLFAGTTSGQAQEEWPNAIYESGGPIDVQYERWWKENTRTEYQNIPGAEEEFDVIQLGIFEDDGFVVNFSHPGNPFNRGFSGLDANDPVVTTGVENVPAEMFSAPQKLVRKDEHVQFSTFSFGQLWHPLRPPEIQLREEPFNLQTPLYQRQVDYVIIGEHEDSHPNPDSVLVISRGNISPSRSFNGPPRLRFSADDIQSKGWRTYLYDSVWSVAAV